MKRRVLLTLAAALVMTLAAAAQALNGPKRLKSVFKNQRQARMLPVQRKAAETPSPSLFNGLQVYVNLTNSDDWEQLGLSDTPYGIYTYTLGSGQDFQPLATSYLYGFMASAMGRSEFVGVRPMEVFGALQGVEYDGLSGDDFSKQWAEVYMDVDYSYAASAMAYDPTSGEIYSLQYNANLTGMNLCVWNEELRVFDPIEAWPNRFQPVAMAFDPAGQLYCLGGDGNYYKIDKQTGEATLVAAMNVEPTLYVQSMAYDNRSGYFIWMATEQTGSAFYAVEPQSGQATLISRLPKNEQAASVFFRHSDAKAKAPAAVGNLRFSYSADGATTGNLVFTVPTTTFDGSNLGQGTTMNVWLDGRALATDVSVEAGAAQTFAFDVDPGNHYAYVVLKNADGFSPAGSVYAYAGYDYPLPVSDVNLSITNGTATLAWAAPAGGVNGGYIDRDALTYDVVRMPGEVLVAKDTKNTDFTEVLPAALERYYYVVTPKNGPDRVGQSAESNQVLAGTAYEPPYADNFSDTSTQSLWTVVNANDDRGSWGTEFTWQYSSWSGYWSINTSSYNMGDDEPGMDDWMISPGISLATGSAYALTVRLSNSFAHYAERVALLMGTDPTDLTTFRVMDSNEAYDVEGKPTDWEVDFTVDEPATYYFAVRCYTQRDDQGSSLSLLRLAVDRLGATGAPAEATALTITPEPTGELRADISFVAPATTLGGDALTGTLQADIYRDAEPVATVSTEAGQPTTWTDEAVPAVGMHTYAVALRNAAGAGKRTEAEAFIGVFTAPYYNTFDVADDARFFTTVNDSAFYSSNEYRWIWDSYSHYLALGGYGYLVQHPEERIWLYMPAIKLEADQVYTYSFDWSNSSYYESCLGYAGIGMAPDSTAQTLFPGQLPFTGYSDLVTVENEVITTETGKYYPSILVIDNHLYDYASPKIDNVSIVHVGSARAPFAVSDLTLTPDAAGRLEAVLSFTAPATDYAQRTLTEPLTVNIYREGSPIPVATLNDVQPGQQLQWTEAQPLNGRNAYTVVAQNGYGRGKSASVEGFVGIDVPMAVQNLRVRGNADNQKAVISWDAPADKGQNGGVIDGSLTYSVLEYFPDETDADRQLSLLTTTTETTFTADREPTDEMEQHHYFVVPQTSGGVGEAAYEFVVLGRLKSLPFAESFADGYLSASGWVELSDGAQYGTKWYIIPDDDQEQLYSQDGDNGLAFCFNGNYMDAPHWDELITPKMQVDGGGHYTVSFYVYTGMPLYTNAQAPRLEVELSQDDGDFTALCAPIDITQGETGWTLFQLPFVAEAATHHVKFCFRGTMNNMAEHLLLDNITVAADDGIVGIAQIQNVPSGGDNKLYDLQGRQRQLPAKGLNIHVGATSLHKVLKR